MSEPRQRVEILILGTVQGVGFRPFVYRLARQLHVTGSIINTASGVSIEAEGTVSALRSFLESLEASPPPLARISVIEHRILDFLKGDPEFSIKKSHPGSTCSAVIPADIAMCSDCLQDISEPDNRRFSYPFTNCTNCGPRFTIVESLPYDRSGTSMKVFPQCPVCAREYQDPDDRRFHAQPNACPLCGPHLSFHDGKGRKIETASPLSAAARTLKKGEILALRGLGGFHLAADASSSEAVDLLRVRKQRPDKPLAIMVADIKTAAAIASLTKNVEKLLLSREHPIVIVPVRRGLLAQSLAPGLLEIGLMLPYTPVHQLLFLQKDCPRCLVMTSGNISGMPIFTANSSAIKGLQGIADYFLFHNRDIVTRVDDSVARCTGRGVQLLRRARGYVPSAITLVAELPPVLACGAGLKATFCLTRGAEGFVSQHIGDLFNLESLDFYKESISHLQKLLQVEPELAVADLHPDYLSSHYARESGLPLCTVQHHHAHAAAVMAEHGLQGKVLALVLDGTGLGDDGTLWGGEVLETDCLDYKRAGSLSAMMLPGGDVAALEPWRMGLSLLNHAGKKNLVLPSHFQIAENKINTVLQMMSKDFNSPLSTSCGRLFDGVASLLGVRQSCSFEAQAAMELEALALRARKEKSLADLFSLYPESAAMHFCDGRMQLRQKDLILMLLDRQRAGENPADLALFFHIALIRSLVLLIQYIARERKISRIILSGGCLQNMLLQDGLFFLLEQEGLQVFTGLQIPVNDGGISLGQAVIGGLRHVSGSTHEGP